MIQVRLGIDVNVLKLDSLIKDLISYRLYFETKMKMHDFIKAAPSRTIINSIDMSVASRDLRIRERFNEIR